MLLTQIEYFVALARERHFGRAAAACHVSQSALSEAIRKLETELDILLVRRGRAFEGLTAEGEQLLVWARRIVADEHALRDAVGNLRTGLAGRLHIGAVPSATLSAAQLVERFCTAHPLASVELETGLPTATIARRIREFDLDAGIVYPGEESDGLAVSLLDRQEQQVVMTRSLAHRRTAVTGAELNGLPLAALPRAMRGRQLLDEALGAHGIELRPQVEADSVDALIGLAATGRRVSVVPHLPSGSDALPPGLLALELVEPRVTAPLVYATRAEEPVSLLARAMTRIVREGAGPVG